MSHTSMVMHLIWNASVGKPVGLENRTPKHIDDHIGCFECWVVSKHIFHSDCFLDDNSDHCHCWKISELHEKNQNTSLSYLKTFTRSSVNADHVQHVFPVITAVHMRILMFFFAHPENTKNTSMCSMENTPDVFPISYLGILKGFWACPNNLECCVLLKYVTWSSVISGVDYLHGYFPYIFFFNVFSVVWIINVTLQTAEFISMGYCKKGITP